MCVERYLRYVDSKPVTWRAPLVDTFNGFLKIHPFRKMIIEGGTVQAASPLLLFKFPLLEREQKPQPHKPHCATKEWNFRVQLI